MTFNYAKEKHQFDREWSKTEKEYMTAGMSQEKIHEMKAFDWDWFCSRRRYSEHNQVLPNEVIDDDGNQSELTTLFRKFDSLSTEMQPNYGNGRYGWVEEIENQTLSKRLRKLSDDDLELLTLLVFDEYTQSKLSEKMLCNQSVISRKIKRIKVFLK